MQVGGRVLFFFFFVQGCFSSKGQANYGRTTMGEPPWKVYTMDSIFLNFSISRSITELTISDRESSCCLTESYGSKEAVPHPTPTPTPTAEVRYFGPLVRSNVTELSLST